MRPPTRMFNISKSRKSLAGKDSNIWGDFFSGIGESYHIKE